MFSSGAPPKDVLKHLASAIERGKYIEDSVWTTCWLFAHLEQSTICFQ